MHSIPAGTHGRQTVDHLTDFHCCCAFVRLCACIETAILLLFSHFTHDVSSANHSTAAANSIFFLKSIFSTFFLSVFSPIDENLNTQKINFSNLQLFNLRTYYSIKHV